MLTVIRFQQLAEAYRHNSSYWKKQATLLKRILEHTGQSFYESAALGGMQEVALRYSQPTRLRECVLSCDAKSMMMS